jgi:hypothetical protein
MSVLSVVEELQSKVNQIDEGYKTVLPRLKAIEGELAKVEDLAEAERLLQEQRDLTFKRDALRFVERVVRPQLREAERWAAEAHRPAERPWRAPEPPPLTNDSRRVDPDPPRPQQFFRGLPVDRAGGHTKKY